MTWVAVAMLGSTVALVVAGLAMPKGNRLALAVMVLGGLAVVVTGAAMLLAMP